MKKNRNRISKHDTIKAISFDKNGKTITSVYDSHFTSIRKVMSVLKMKGSGWLKEIKYITIYNEDKCWYGRYLPSGRKI